jgi:hypothetical protein
MIPQSLERLQSTRTKTMQLVAGLSQEDFDRRPSRSRWILGEAGSWSIGEIIDHIMRVADSLTDEIEELIRLKEAGQNPEIRRSFRDYDASPVILPKGFMPYFEPAFALASSVSSALLPPTVRESFIRTRSFPIRNPARWLPVRGLPAEILKGELGASMARLQNLLERHPSIDFNQLVLHHTIFGRYNVPELLNILAIHEEWHRPDIEALLRRGSVA